MVSTQLWCRLLCWKAGFHPKLWGCRALMKERDRSNYQDMGHISLCFSGMILFWPNPHILLHHLWGPCRTHLWISALHQLLWGSWNPYCLPSELQQVRLLSSPSALNQVSPGQDRLLNQYTVMHARSHNNHLSSQNCQKYSYVGQQRKDLSMNWHKVVKFNLIQEIWNVFEKEKCPKCFMDSHAPHSHGHKTVGMLQHGSCPPRAALPPGTCSAHYAHSS